MPNPPAPGRRCAVAGCNAWAIRNQEYCSAHYHQWQQNLRLGVPDAAPKLIGRSRRMCRARACTKLAIANSEYCAKHTEQYRAEAANTEAVAEGFATLLARLDDAAPDCIAVIQRELDLLASARRILVAHAEMSSRAGWKAISSMTFIRLWLSSAATVTDLAKARFVMETATSADFDRLLGGVYGRIEREAIPEQQPLPGMLPAPQDPDPALQPSLFADPTPSPCTRGEPQYSGARVGGQGSGSLSPVPRGEGQGGGGTRLSSPEEQLVEWLIDANAALGTRLVAQTMAALVAEAPKLLVDPPLDHVGAAALVALTDALPPVHVDAPPAPADLGARLSTLAEIMDQSPDLTEVRAIISRHTSPANDQPDRL